MRYLTLGEVLEIYGQVVHVSGGGVGIRDLAGLESALAQPRQSFGGQDLYPSLADKAAALGHSLVLNHPFVDGNKRAAHAVMEVFLILNGHEIDAPVDEQERTMLEVASGKMNRADFTAWVSSHIKEKS
jgi:death-on-curing protein